MSITSIEAHLEIQVDSLLFPFEFFFFLRINFKYLSVIIRQIIQEEVCAKERK